MEYLTKKNRRKIMARHGLKQIGEHMHVVTRTMSADPSGMYHEYFTRWREVKFTYFDVGNKHIEVNFNLIYFNRYHSQVHTKTSKEKAVG